MRGADAAVRSSPPESTRACGRFSFPRGRRLTRPREFRHVYRSKKVRHAHGQFLALAWVANGLAHARLGFAISRQAQRRSVRRNLLKRCVREHFRQHPPPCVDLVVSGRRRAPAASDIRAVRAELERLWERIAP